MSKLEPLGDRIVIKTTKMDGKTESGIYIPETASQEKPEQGEVIAVGPGRLDESGKRIAISVKVGDTVMFTKYGPDEVELDGDKYLIVREDNLLAVIK